MVFDLSLSPSDFFSLTVEIAHGKLAKKVAPLPDTSELFPEESFGEVSLAWHMEGISVFASVNKKLENPDEDCLELFFDTRDLKTAGFTTRFSHHFILYPREGASREVTHFRTEDTHPLCDSSDLEVSFREEKKSYQLEGFIPAHCLHGYDPLTFDRLGFNYRLNRVKGEPQHFALSSKFFALEQHPSLWATLKLKLTGGSK